MSRLRYRFSRAARAWLAGLALQFAVVPVAEAAARPVAVMVCAAAEHAPSATPAREAAGRAARLPIADAPRVIAAAPRALPPPNTRAKRVLVPRLYLRLLSIRR